MTLYCTEEFKAVFDALKKNNSYATLEASLVETYCHKTFEEARTGTLLNDLKTAVFVKKRLEGRGGFRFYVLAVIQDECVYLTFVHPKSGKHGGDNITKEKHHELLKTVLTVRRSGGTLYEITPSPTEADKAVFTRQQAAPARPTK